MATIDSYSETNQSAAVYLQTVHPSADSKRSAAGQSFTGLAGYKLTSCKFYLKKEGSPVGNLVAVVYAHSGTFGTSSVPTGSALATSDAVAMASLPTDYALVTFTFSTPLTLSASYYCLVLQANDATTLDATNQVLVGADNTSPTHSGNAMTYHDSAWDALNTADICFYALGLLTSPKGGVSKLMGVVVRGR